MRNDDKRCESGDAGLPVYAPPTVSDLGTLSRITAGFQGLGGPDAAFPGDPLFPDASPPFGP